MKIFIASNPNFENKGDASILYGTSYAFKELLNKDDIHITLYSPRAEYDRKWDHGFDDIVDGYQGNNKYINYLRRKILSFFPLALIDLIIRWITKNKFAILMPKKVWLAFKKSDVVLVGLNGTYTGIFGGKKGLLSMFGDIGIIGNSYWIWLSLIDKKYTVLFSSSTEPSPWWLQRKVTYESLKRTSLLITRENKSIEYLRKLGINKEIYCCADMAFLTPEINIPIDLKARIKKLRKKTNIIVGITISIRVGRVWFPDDENKKYKTLIAFTKLCEEIHNKSQAGIIFIPHSVGPSSYSDDRIPAVNIANALGNPDWLMNIIDDYSPTIIKSIIGKCDVLIGCRTHSVIHSLNQKIPSLVISSTPFRAIGIIGDLLGNTKWIYSGKYSERKLYRKIMDLINNRSSFFTEKYDEKIADARSKSLNAARLVIDKNHR